MTETQQSQQPTDGLLQEYERFCRNAYHADAGRYLAAAKAFVTQYPAPSDWAWVLQNRVDTNNEGILGFLALTGRLRVPLADLIKGKLPLAELFRRGMIDLKTWFEDAAAALGYSRDLARYGGPRCWVFWAAMEGKRLMEVTVDGGNHLRTAMRDFEFGSRTTRRHWTGLVFGVHKTLHHAGVLPVPPKRHNLGRGPMLKLTPWCQVHPDVQSVVERYLEQYATIRRPGTAKATRTGLTQFFRWLYEEFPEVTKVELLERRHIERWKVHLANRPGVKSKCRSGSTRAGFLSSLANFLRNISVWEWPEAPQRQLIHFPNDYPTLDAPLPRFLPDDAATALLKAAQASDDPFTRVVVTTLLRTGLRRGEFLRLTVDSVVRIGSSDWLRVPVGKLHNDRYVPLHPDARRCLDEWVSERGQQPWTDLMFVRYGEPIARRALADAVQRAATAAGLGRVTPHQLRHTLATQAVNRGMSLESIAAMLGHRSLSMTLVYARIANRTVEKEYFNVTRQLDQHASVQVAVPEGFAMANLRREMDWRRLGNGYCTRPKKMPCEYETICETCTMFMTTPEFLPTLQIQKKDAEHKGQVGRVRVFCDLIAKVEEA